MSETVGTILNGAASIPAQIEAQEPNLPKLSVNLKKIASMLPAGPVLPITVPAEPTVPAPPSAFTSIFSKLPAAPDLTIPSMNTSSRAARASDVIIPPPASQSIPGGRVNYAGTGGNTFTFK
jgi:hypothetical protein